ncbi:MAG: acylneuraminate cytidylyltransferase family protein [Magnetococcales bacterium]|nr:acylneuraminate cytidylyltransferase family protein [Magnetococcales bacterium]
MKILAIIPARGGSKGIPRKNLALLGGKPLLVHSIEHCQQVAAIHRIVVSTDDAEIGQVAQQHGAEVVWRPTEISGDAASSESALRHVLDTLTANEGYAPDLVVFLQATSPLRQPSDLQNAIDLLIRENADSAFSYCKMHGKLWHRTQGLLDSVSYDYRNRQPRQHMPEELLENGSFFLFKPWVLRQHDNRLGGKIVAAEMPYADSLDVDEPPDLLLAERLLATRTPS